MSFLTCLLLCLCVALSVAPLPPGCGMKPPTATGSDVLMLPATVRDVCGRGQTNCKRPDGSDMTPHPDFQWKIASDAPLGCGLNSCPLPTWLTGNWAQSSHSVVNNQIHPTERRPVFNASAAATLTNPGPNVAGGSRTINSDASLKTWYNDDPAYNQKTSLVLPLTRDYDSAGNPKNTFSYSCGSFWPIDNQLMGNFNTFGHNYHLTMHASNRFTYKGGEVFTFSGDDDVWVFINDFLVIDLGGVHTQWTGSVSLDAVKDSIGIVVGGTYNFDFFWAERHTTLSNFRITTSIELSCPRFDNCGVCEGDSTSCCTCPAPSSNCKRQICSATVVGQCEEVDKCDTGTPCSIGTCTAGTCTFAPPVCTRNDCFSQCIPAVGCSAAGAPCSASSNRECGQFQARVTATTAASAGQSASTQEGIVYYDAPNARVAWKWYGPGQAPGDPDSPGSFTSGMQDELQTQCSVATRITGCGTCKSVLDNRPFPELYFDATDTQSMTGLCASAIAGCNCYIKSPVPSDPRAITAIWVRTGASEGFPCQARDGRGTIYSFASQTKFSDPLPAAFTARFNAPTAPCTTATCDSAVDIGILYDDSNDVTPQLYSSFVADAFTKQLTDQFSATNGNIRFAAAVTSEVATLDLTQWAGTGTIRQNLVAGPLNIQTVMKQRPRGGGSKNVYKAATNLLNTATWAAGRSHWLVIVISGRPGCVENPAPSIGCRVTPADIQAFQDALVAKNARAIVVAVGDAADSGLLTAMNSLAQIPPNPSSFLKRVSSYSALGTAGSLLVGDLCTPTTGQLCGGVPCKGFCTCNAATGAFQCSCPTCVQPTDKCLESVCLPAADYICSPPQPKTICPTLGCQTNTCNPTSGACEAGLPVASCTAFNCITDPCDDKDPCTIDVFDGLMPASALTRTFVMRKRALIAFAPLESATRPSQPVQASASTDLPLYAMTTAFAPLTNV